VFVYLRPNLCNSYVRTLSWMTYNLFRRVYESHTTNFLRTQQWWIGPQAPNFRKIRTWEDVRKFFRLMKILGNTYDNADFWKNLKKFFDKVKKNLRPLQSCLRKLRNRLHHSSVCKQKQTMAFIYPFIRSLREGSNALSLVDFKLDSDLIQMTTLCGLLITWLMQAQPLDAKNK